MKFLSGKGFETQLAGRTLIGGVTGGIGAEISGDDFGNGFTTGAASASIGFLCNDRLEWLREACSAYWEAGKLTPERVEALGKHMNYYVDNSGLKNMPELARTAGVAMGAGVALSVGYAAYPMAMATAPEWMPYAGELASQAISQLSGPNISSPPADLLGAGLTIYDAIKDPDKYFKMNKK